MLSGESDCNGEKGNCDFETRPGNDALRRRQTPAGGRLAGRPDEARRRLNHLRQAVGSTVGEALGVGSYPSFCRLLADLRGKLAEMRANQGELQQGSHAAAEPGVF